MSSGDEETSPSLNVRLRPRKPLNSTPISSVVSRKSDDHDVTLKRTNTQNKEKDLNEKADILLSPQYLCIYCEKKFASNQTVSKHIRRIHLSPNKKPDSLAKCIFCCHAETNLTNIVQHMLDNHPNDYFACLDCNIRLLSASELKEHKSNLCEKQRSASHFKTPQKNATNSKRNKKTTKIETKASTVNKEIEDINDFTGIVISCELKPSQLRDEEDIEDNITTNVILPRTKPLNNSSLERTGLIVLDDIQWGKRISQGLSFHNTDADQILSRLGVVHRSPRAGETVKKEGKAVYDESTQKFEKCFDTNFYSKVASNVHENLTKYLDGSFNFKTDPDNIVTTRRSKYSVNINTAEGFPILLACEQYSRNAYDGYLPRVSALKHKWKWGNAELEKSLLSPFHMNRDSHTNNCIITLVSSLDIWTQLCMRKKFDQTYNRFVTGKANERQNLLGKELKEILESREISKPGQLVPYQNRQTQKGDKINFSASLGLVPSAPSYNVEPAVLSGEWVRPRCYVCCACGAQTRDSRTLTSHITTKHPNAQVQHYEIVGELLLNSDILKHLYVPPSSVSNRTRPLRGFKECTKCNKSISLEDLHQHMLDCAGDAPAVRRKQCRYRLFGVRKRRPRLPDNTVRKKIRKDIRNQQKRQKSRMRSRQSIRSEVGDAETIRKMIADLPAKRQRVLVNPHQITRPRRHLERKRNKLAVKQRITGESSKVKDVRKNNDIIQTPAKTTVKSKIVRVISTRQNSAALGRKVALSRLKKKSMQCKDKNQTDVSENEVVSKDSKSQHDSLSLEGQSQRKSLNDVSFNAKEHGNKSGSSNNNQQHSNHEGGQNNSNNAQMPAQNTPLKHSIAQLTANSERHDKSVQFHHLFLVQQECNDANQPIKQFHKYGSQTLFENEETVIKPDKPPLNLFQIYSGENRSKFRQNKPRKGLNDCIAMLKNKLTDVTPHTGHVSVKCGSDEPIEPIISDVRQQSGKISSYVSSNWTFCENKTSESLSTMNEESVSEPGNDQRINSKDITNNNIVPHNNFPKDQNKTTEHCNQAYDVLLHDLPNSKSQDKDNTICIPQSHQDKQNIRLIEKDVVSKQKGTAPQLTSKSNEVNKPVSYTSDTEVIIVCPKKIANEDKNQYAIESLIETCAEKQVNNDFHFLNSKEVLPTSKIEVLTTDIPMAHASTKVESIISTPLDLSLKVNTSNENLYSLGNNDDYETLDLSNKSCVPIPLETNVAEFVVDLSLKSYKNDVIYEQQTIPTDLSSRIKEDSMRNKTEMFNKSVLISNKNIGNQLSKMNSHDMTLFGCGEPQENYESIPVGRTDTCSAELKNVVFSADYCMPNKSTRKTPEIVSNCKRSEELKDQHVSLQSYKNTPAILSQTEESAMVRSISANTSLGTLNHLKIDNSLQHRPYIQQGNAVNLSDDNLSKNFVPSTQTRISDAFVHQASSKDKPSVLSNETYTRATLEINVTSNYVRGTTEDYVTAANTPKNYTGTVSQLNTFKCMVEEQSKEKPRKIDTDNELDLASKVSMLPKELVEVLGKMPVDHRNQLMDILKQYVSSPTTSTHSQYEAARSYMSTAGLLTDSNMSVLQKQQAGDNTVTTSDFHTLNRTIVSPSIKDSKATYVEKSDKINEPDHFDSAFMLKHTDQSNTSSDRVVNLIENEKVSHIKLQEPYVSVDYSSSEKAIKQRSYSDQTASLRAVRIKAPSERRKEVKLINEKQNLKEVESTELENSEVTNEFLAIQQAEVSSTQHSVRNMVIESQIPVSHKHEPAVEYSNDNTGLSNKCNFGSHKASVKATIVTSSIIKNDINNIKLVQEEEKQKPSGSETKEELINKENLQQFVPMPQIQTTCTKDLQSIITNEKSKQVSILDLNESKNNAIEDDSDDDISLALIVKQKNNNSAIPDSKSKDKSSKKKIKKVGKHRQKHRRKQIRKSHDSILTDSKNIKSENVETRNENMTVMKEKEKNQYTLVTDKVIKPQDLKPEILPANINPAEKSKDQVEEMSPLPVTISQGEDTIEKSYVEDFNNDIDNKSLKKTLRSRKTNVVTEPKRSPVEESVPLRRSRRGKSLVFSDFDNNRPDILETKPLLTKKQLIFSKLLLDNEVLQGNKEIPDVKMNDNSDHISSVKECAIKKNEPLNIDLTTDKSFPLKLLSQEDGHKKVDSLEIIKKTEDKKSGNSCTDSVSENLVTECNLDEPSKQSPITDIPLDAQEKLLSSNKSVEPISPASTQYASEFLKRKIEANILKDGISANHSSLLADTEEYSNVAGGRNNDHKLNLSQCTADSKFTVDKQFSVSTRNTTEQSTLSSSVKLVTEELQCNELAPRSKPSSKRDVDNFFNESKQNETNQLVSEQSILSQSINTDKQPKISPSEKCEIRVPNETIHEKLNISFNTQTTKLSQTITSQNDNLNETFGEESDLSLDVPKHKKLSKHSQNIPSENNKTDKSFCVELNRHESKTSEYTVKSVSIDQNSEAEEKPTQKSTKLDETESCHKFSTKKKKMTEEQQVKDENDLDIPIAARRARSKSVVMKTYDPYDIDMDNMDEETKPLTSLLKEKRKSNLVPTKRKDTITNTTELLLTDNDNENSSITNTKLRIKVGKKDTSIKLVKEDKRNYKNAEENAIYSDDSTKSDEPLQKYVTEKKATDTHKKSQKVAHSKTKLIKSHNDSKVNTKGCEVKETETSLESEEQIRSEQFMESFGFFSQRKPRKSNLLASKKISETFHSISVESDDTSDAPKTKITKKSVQTNDENKKNKRGRKKKEPVPVAMTTRYCMICKKEFRRPDNYVRHQMTLLHVSKLCEVELNIKTPPIFEETNYLIAYKTELDKIKKKSEEDKLLNKKVVMPTLEEILVKVHKTIRAQQLSRRGLSRDEALFLDCCELLKKSHKTDLHKKDTGSLISDIDNLPPPHCSIANFTQNINENKANLRSDGDVDSLTAKNILESEEVRNLENDLISGLKEAAEMHLRNSAEHSLNVPGASNELTQDGLDQSYTMLRSKECNTSINSKEDSEMSKKLNSDINLNPNVDSIIGPKVKKQEKTETKDLKQDETAISEPDNTVLDTIKIKKSLEVKEKMYPDLENIDIFEDKFDKIKRKCRSQAAAARQTQITIENTSRNKERKKADKSKLRKTSKKKQHSTILTKGALKGFDNIKESGDKISDVYNENYPKKKRKSNSKKKKDKKVNKDDNNDTKVNESSSSQKKIDVYEFMDNDDVELFELRPSTLMERFKNINNKETLNKGTHKPSLDYEDADGFTSESGSDGDDFVYMSDDYVVGSDNETENSVVSCETENGTEIKKVQRKKDITEKNAVMGKIFKNNAVRGEKRLAKYRETAKHKANLDKLFDSLLTEEPIAPQDDLNTNENKQMSHPSSEDCNTLTNAPYDNFSPPKEISVRKRKRSDDHIGKDIDIVSSPKKSNTLPIKTYEKDSDDEKINVSRDTTKTITERNKDCADDSLNYNLLDEHGIAPQRARRKCTVGKQNVLAETWSSESEPDLTPSRPNSVESDATVVGRKKKIKRKDGHTSANRRNKQKVNVKKQDLESRLHKSNRVKPTSSAKSRGRALNEPDERDINTNIETCPDDPYHMPTPSTSGYDGSSQRRSRTSSYYWSGDGEEEPEHPQQHGWIVGDSHKKLVTMLAHAKGRKRNVDNSLVD